MKMRRSLTISVLAASLALLATGCGQERVDAPKVVTTGNPAAEAAPQGPKVFKKNWPEKVPSHGLTKGMALPLEKYMISYSDEINVQLARDNAETACMRRYGFTNWRTEDLGTSPPQADNASNMPRRYGLSDLAEAQEYGYHLPQVGEESTPPPEQDVPDAGTVLQGSKAGEKVASFKGKDLPAGGCTGEVKRKVGTPDVDLVEKLSLESFSRSQQAPAVKTAMAQWASCMKESGYNVTTVWDTTKVVSTEGPTATPEEIKISTAEVKCKQKTGLIKVWYNEEAKIQKQLIAANNSALDGSKVGLEKTLNKAAGVNKAAKQ